MTSSPPDPRARARLLIAIALASALSVALIVALVSSSEDGSGGGPASAGFEPVYEDLEQRREAAGVSTMGEPADPDAHLHPKLALYAEGERIQIPVNIGIDPAKSGDAMASLHTHETDGTIHMEGMSDATLGQLFEIWGIPFSESELGPYQAEGDKEIRMWVEGQPATDFEGLRLADGQQIVIAYGTPEQVAAAAPE